jgi:ABC-type multidrug transport system fused ATPase/permease subunit
MLALVRRTIQILSPRYRRRVVLLELGALLSAVIDAAAFGLLYPLIQLLTHSGNGLGENSAIRTVARLFGTTDKSTLEVRLSVTIVILFVLSSVVGIVLTYAQSRVVAGSEAEVASRLFTRYLHAPYAEHLERNSAKLVRNVQNAVADIHQLVLMSLLIIGANVMQVVIITGVIAIVSPLVTVVALGYFLLVTGVYVKVVSPRAQRAGREYHTHLATAIRVSQEGFGGIKTLQAYDATEPMAEEYRRSKHDLAASRHTMVYYTQLPQYYLQSALIGGIVLFVGVVYLIGRSSSTSVTALIGLVMAASIRLMPALYTTLSSINRIRNGQAALNEISYDLERLDPTRLEPAETLEPVESLEPEEPAEPTVAADAAEPARAGSPFRLPMTMVDSLEFDRVSFRYPGADRLALDAVSFTIARGSSVALVGRSGAGKTTVVDLLLGLFPVTDGEIRVDGVALDSATVKAWRRRVGYVPQEVFLLDGSVRDNVRFSRQGDPPPAEEIWAVLERAQIGRWVAGLPDGLDTVVGERGVRLSGGQRQRLGIARALFREPEVLILDEATSALDTSTEAAVTETIASLQGTLTMIIIAHRLSTVRNCETLVLLEDGRVVGEGGFDALRRESDLFSELARLSDIQVAR